MVRILYGVCGVGAGHYMRSKILISELIKKHEVFILAGLAAYDYFKKDFKNVHWIEGLEFAFKDNKVLSLRTILKNIKKISKKNYHLLKNIKIKIDKFDPEIVISDFEPFSIYYAKENQIKSIGFDNEHYLIEGNFNFPGKYKINYFKTKFIINFYKTDETVITIFPNQKLKKESKSIAVRPLIRKELLNAKSKNSNKILVYTSIIKNKNILEILKKSNQEFIIFGSEEEKSENNIIFKKFSETDFNKELINCKAVICTGGMNLISEAIYLGRPMLVIPIRNHFEQILNALYVRTNKYGEFYEELTESNLLYFLNNLEKYKTIKFLPGNKEALNIIIELLKRGKK
ncbi:hypothetical protein J4440_01925 [Candidatus Woesearchaeota archaeon]|nr:hypothetical protein [Candidatus Woesearchaeota archaeon]